jgi:hypothetical protein
MAEPPEDAVIVVDQKARSALERTRLAQLLLHPREARARRHVHVNDSARRKMKHDEDVGAREERGRLHEEVAGVDSFGLVREKRSPALAPSAPPVSIIGAEHVPSNGAR